MNRPVTVTFGGRSYSAAWRVVGERVEIEGELGSDSAPLGPLSFAPATAARERLMEMARRAAAQDRPREGDRSRFDVSEVFKRPRR